MWSEHCSYKSSRVHLKTLPTTGKRVLQGPGENAGAVDIGDGLAAVFKIESHNHPSFIEPYQGAATGVGGIIRDIFTMGARPIALLNSLRFGPLDEPLVRRTFAGVVAGIAGYGNSIGIPTVGGEIAFDESYTGNPLVNVFCLGISKADEIIKGVASGRGQRRLLRRREDRPRRHPRRDHGVGGVRRQVGGEAAGRAGGRSVHGEAAARGVPRGDADRRARRHPGHGRGRADVFDLRNGIARRRRCRDRRGDGAAARIRHDAVRNHAVRIAGTHAARRQARARSGSRADLREVGSARRPHWRGDDRRPDAGQGSRRGRGRHSHRGADRCSARLQAARWPSRRTWRRRSSCRSARLARRRPPADGLPAAAGVAGYREQALGVPPVRPHGPHQHAGVSGHGRGSRAREGHAPRTRAVGRRQRALRLPRSVPRARSWRSPKRRAMSRAPEPCRLARPTA